MVVGKRDELDSAAAAEFYWVLDPAYYNSMVKRDIIEKMPDGGVLLYFYSAWQR